MIILYYIYILFAGSIIFDLLYGEPPYLLHPVVLTGKIIAKLEKFFLKHNPKKFYGLMFLITVIIVNTLPVLAVLYFLYYIHSIASIIIFSIIYIYFLKSIFTIKSMKTHINPVLKALESGDIEKAREKVSMVVRRDTSNMDETHIISACIETVSEGFVDGYMTPLFFYAFGGIGAGIAVKIINTMDSNVAYKNSEFYEFGRATAIADTLTNYIPSRMSVYFFYISAWLLGYRNIHVKIINTTDSLNAGYSMGAMADILGIWLEKPGEYIINDGGSTPKIRDVSASLKIYSLSAILFALIFVIPVITLLFLLHLLILI